MMLKYLKNNPSSPSAYQHINTQWR